MGKGLKKVLALLFFTVAGAGIFLGFLWSVNHWLLKYTWFGFTFFDIDIRTFILGWFSLIVSGFIVLELDDYIRRKQGKRFWE